MHLLIVCQAGKKIGLGHLSRVIVMAIALRRDLKANVDILIHGEKIHHNDLDTFRHEYLTVERDLVLEVISYLDDHHPDIIIFDLSPKFIPSNLKNLLFHIQRHGIKVVSIDGLIEYAPYLDLLFIPSFYFPKSEDIATPTKVIWGWDCYLIRAVYSPILWQPGNRVMILTGGSDVMNLGKTMLIELNEALPTGCEIHWVSGPYAELPTLPDLSRSKITIHKAPSNLDGLIKDIHYALTIFGVSFFELLYYGVPTVVFSPYGDTNDRDLMQLKKLGVASVAKTKEEAILQLSELMQQDKLARSLSKRSREQLPTSGTKKFTTAIKELTS